MRLQPLILCSLLSIALSCQIAPAAEPPSEKPASKPPAAKEKTKAKVKPATKAKPEATKPTTYKVKREPFQIRVELQGLFESATMNALDLRPQSPLTLTVTVPLVCSAGIVSVPLAAV